MNDNKSNNNSNNNNANKSTIEESIFHLLNPTLRLLLSCNDQLNQNYTSTGSSSSTVPVRGRDSKDEKDILSLYKIQFELFQKLEKDLGLCFSSFEVKNTSNSTGIGTGTGSSSYQNDEAYVSTNNDTIADTTACTNNNSSNSSIIRKALHEMEEYISLPIIISLQQYYKNINIIHKKDDDNNNSNCNNIIILNSQRKVIECASSSLTTYIQLLFKSNYHMMTKVRLKCIVAISMTLTTMLQQRQQQHHQHQRQTEWNNTNANNNLDKGDYCIQSLLKCLNTLLLPPPSLSSSPIYNNNKIQNQFVIEFMNYLPNGGLINGIIQNCLQCMDDMNNNDIINDNHYNQHTLTSIYNNNKCKDDNELQLLLLRGKNVEVKINALHVMEALFKLHDYQNTRTTGSDNITRCFQRIFPLCFTVSTSI